IRDLPGHRTRVPDVRPGGGRVRGIAGRMATNAGVPRHPPGSARAGMTTDLLAFFRAIERLKRTSRTGWLDRGIPSGETESVADHTLLTALIAWTLAQDDPTLDADRVLKLA